MDLGLRDRVCVVTGSTGGIGLETARLLAAEGARVVVTGRDSERVESARQAAGAARRVIAGPQGAAAALGITPDLPEPAAAEAVIGETTTSLGEVDCLVNNVGVAYQASFDELTDEQWDAMWQAHGVGSGRASRAG